MSNRLSSRKAPLLEGKGQGGKQTRDTGISGQEEAGASGAMVKKGATIGANATVICGVTLGRYSLVGAGAVVTKDVPDYGMVYGNPARFKGWICGCGIKLEFVDNGARCKSCGVRYEKQGDAIAEGRRQKAEGKKRLLITSFFVNIR